MIRFDAYSATTPHAKPQDLLQLIAEVVPMSSGWAVKEGKGFHSYANRLGLKGADGVEFASIMSGGEALHHLHRSQRRVHAKRRASS